jgi:hypothetical protein
MTWDGTIFTASSDYTGPGSVSNMTLSSSTPFFFSLWTAHDVQVFGPGTYTFDVTLGGGVPETGTLTMTVGPSQLGAHMLFDWGGSSNIDVATVWNKDAVFGNPNDSTAGVGNVVGQTFNLASSDANGDQVSGIPMPAGGPFAGMNANFNLNGIDFLPPPPDIRVSIDVAGGTTQECTATGGSTVAISADVTLIGEAELASVTWTIDGASAGSGEAIAPLLTLGSHTIQALATATTGESDTASTVVSVVDTTPPTVDAHFLDGRTGEPVDSISGSEAQFGTVSFGASDVCDPAVETQGTVTPTFGVNDGDTIKLQGNNQTVKLPTTALERSVVGTDHSGNTATDQAILSISN